ncbi:MAG: hypothetical protein ACKO3B_05980 [Bacteroidota bacterium]
MKNQYLICRNLIFPKSVITACLLALVTTAQAQTARLEQALNGGVGLPPVSPVTWTLGNATETSSHYKEGESIPYRMVLSNLSAGTHTLVIGWGIRNSSKSAIDYITGLSVSKRPLIHYLV